MSYTPQLGIGDAISMSMTNRPGRTAGRIAAREGSRYGVSQLGEQFYNNNRFTGLGGGMAGGAVGLASGLLSGDHIAEKTGLGAASGLAGQTASNAAMDAGASAASSGVVGSMAGSGVGLLGSVLMNGEEGLDNAAASAVGSTLGSAVASGVGLGSYAGPIGAAVGAAIGLIKGAGGPKYKKFYEDIRYEGDDKFNSGGPLTYSNGQWVPRKIAEYRSETAPSKYVNLFKKKHEANNMRLAQSLNSLGLSNVSPDLVSKVNSYVGKLPGTFVNYLSKDHIRDFARARPDIDQTAVRGLADGSYVLTDSRKNGGVMSVKDYLDARNAADGMTEGGDDWAPSLRRGFDWSNIDGYDPGWEEPEENDIEE